MTISSPRRMAIVLITCLMTAGCGTLAYQHMNDPSRDAWQRPKEVVDKVGIHVVKSNGHGIEIHRVKDERAERWRLYTGGGIAANSDKVWLSPIVRAFDHNDPAYGARPRGPYWNKTQLEKALRAWRRGK